MSVSRSAHDTVATLVALANTESPIFGTRAASGGAPKGAQRWCQQISLRTTTCLGISAYAFTRCNLLMLSILVSTFIVIGQGMSSCKPELNSLMYENQPVLKSLKMIPFSDGPTEGFHRCRFHLGSWTCMSR